MHCSAGRWSDVGGWMIWQCASWFHHSISLHSNRRLWNAFRFVVPRMCVHTKTPSTTMGHSVHRADISKMLTHITSNMVTAICLVQLKLKFVCIEHWCSTHRLSSKANSSPHTSVMTFNCIKDNKAIKDWAEILWMWKSTVWSSACVVCFQRFQGCVMFIFFA